MKAIVLSLALVLGASTTVEAGLFGKKRRSKVKTTNMVVAHKSCASQITTEDSQDFITTQLVLNASKQLSDKGYKQNTDAFTNSGLDFNIKRTITTDSDAGSAKCDITVTLAPSGMVFESNAIKLQGKSTVSGKLDQVMGSCASATANAMAELPNCKVDGDGQNTEVVIPSNDEVEQDDNSEINGDETTDEGF